LQSRITPNFSNVQRREEELEMNLTIVTLTGADDTTDVGELVALSKEYPWVEWGILVSQKQEGHGRFPSRSWIDRFTAAAREHRLRVATHLCGKWVRQLLVGEIAWGDLPSCFGVSQRIQINTHAEPHVSTLRMMAHLLTLQSVGRKVIFQWDGVNDHLAAAARAYGVECGILFDKSGGAGELPDSWPAAHPTLPCGYAGGLGPDNVVAQIQRIEAVCSQPYWIDMEGRLRTNDRFNLRAARAVLAQTAAARRIDPNSAFLELPDNPEERRFFRLIEEREPEADGGEKITLACNHSSVYVIPLPPTQQYAWCPICVRAWVEDHIKAGPVGV
jgi:N-(5'phosphoribosyl)anthranilate (PRA) isomerase